MGVYFFADNDPFHFGALPNALLSLFRVITFSNWTDIMYHNMYGAEAYPEMVYGLNVPDITPPTSAGDGIARRLLFHFFRFALRIYHPEHVHRYRFERHSGNKTGIGRRVDEKINREN